MTTSPPAPDVPFHLMTNAQLVNALHIANAKLRKQNGTNSHLHAELTALRRLIDLETKINTQLQGDYDASEAENARLRLENEDLKAVVKAVLPQGATEPGQAQQELDADPTLKAHLRGTMQTPLDQFVTRPLGLTGVAA